MEVFAMIFAVFMIAAALAATILIGMLAGFWPALGFAAVMVLAYRAITRQSGPSRPMRRDTLNAFQRPLSDD